MSELDKAADYHRRSAYRRKSMSGQGLDLENRPNPFKEYTGVKSIALPRDLSLPRANGIRALKGELAREPKPLDLTGLAALLFMSYGFTDQVEYDGELFQYRSVPSAGALYPAEVYLAARDVDGLEDGLYHYSIAEFTLEKLRGGPPPAGISAPALFLTGLYFRSAWKYKDRAYRYCLMDAGHVAENFLIVGPCLGLPVGLDTEFDDEQVNTYLGLNPAKEAAFCAIRLGGGESEGAAPPDVALTRDQAPRAKAVARAEAIFGLITSIGQLTSPPLRGSSPERTVWAEGKRIDLAPADWADFESPTLVQLLQKRRSRRNFRPQTVSRAELLRFLELLGAKKMPDVLDVGFLTNEVQDQADGFWLIGPENSIIQHKGGFLSPTMADASLDQDWVGRGNLILVLTAALDRLEETMGPRSLRLAYLTAGRLGQRAYLAAEAMGWGCCGVGAFFDEEVARLIDLPKDREPLYVLPVGPVKKRTQGGRPVKK